MAILLNPTILGEKNSVVALNKIDIMGEEEAKDIAELFAEETGIEPFLVSAAANQGLNPLVGKMLDMVERAREQKDT